MADASGKADVAEVLTISDLETLRMMSDPLRLRILQSLAERRGRPTTVKEVAQRLGTPATKLYYHVNLLEERGLVRVHDSRVVSGIIEKSYVPTAQSYAVDKNLFALGGEEAAAATTQSLTSLFSNVAMEVQRSISTAPRTADGGAPDTGRLIASKTLARVSHERAIEFRSRLKALIEEFDGADVIDDAEAAGLPTYSLVVAYYPLADSDQPVGESADGAETDV